jgi:long-chain acyl-CoA synthetase
VARSREYPRLPAWWLLERNLPRFSSRVAVVELEPETLEERRRLTYEALWRAVRGVGTALGEHDAGAGVRVGWCAPNGVAAVVAAHGTWYTGGEVVPADPSAPAAELTERLGDAEVTLVIGAAAGTAAAAAEALGVPFVDLEALRAMEGTRPGGPGDYRSEDDAAVIVGDGAAAGAMLSHRNLVANAIQVGDWYAFAAGAEVAFAAVPASGSGRLLGAMNVSLSAGATLVTVPRVASGALGRALARHRVTRRFAETTTRIAPPDDGPGPAPDHAAVGFVIEGHGVAGTGVLTHANPIDRPKPGSIGMPLPDTDARVVDPDTGVDVVPGHPGALLVRGPQVMRGDAKRPPETAPAMPDGWLATGDVATMDDEGYFAIVGRPKGGSRSR